MTKTEVPEDIFGSMRPNPTRKEIQKRWERLVRMSDQLRGWRVQFVNHGGDQLRIDAILEKVSRRADRSVVLTIREATWVCEGEDRTKEELTPEPFPDPELVLDPSYEFPEFFEKDGRIRQVNLPGLDFGDFTIGFLWPS